VINRIWAEFAVSLIFLAFFGAYEYAILYLKLPKDDTLSNILNNLTVLVAGYWIGSSKSSSANAQAAAEAIAKLPKQEEAVVVPKASEIKK
jgi:hypothetical protein